MMIRQYREGLFEEFHCPEFGFGSQAAEPFS
jgi:hypothetical protein